MSEIEPSDDTVARSLDAVHREIGLRHDASRARLLDCLPTECDPPAGQRSYIFGGVGAGVLAAALLLVWAAGPASPASAMERVARALERINSFTYRMEETYTSTKEDGRTVESVFEGRWRREPIALWGNMKLWETRGTATEHPEDRRQIVDVEEAHRDQERGVIIDHLKQHYWRTPPIDSEKNMRGGTPVAIISKVQGRRWRVIRDLGARRLEGREARGLLILLDGSQPAVEVGHADPKADGSTSGLEWTNVEVQLWYDSQTDLPIEFVNNRAGDDFTTVTRYTDFNWNAEFKRGTFAPVAPEGYEELKQSPFVDVE